MKKSSKRGRGNKIRKILKINKRPPSTTRFCLYCEEERVFKYNTKFGHSECMRCGSRMSKGIIKKNS